GFLGSYAGGIAAGLAVSGLVVLVRRHLDDPLREGGLSVLTPFMAFLLAELVHASGVVAVVVAGLVLTYAEIMRASAMLVLSRFSAARWNCSPS
ncbi:MAG TPA: cation:proton antiporter, partial [Pseudonocardia sp.]|nr:cation:proton antiporter [Pseudonocardia sp.]